MSKLNNVTARLSETNEELAELLGDALRKAAEIAAEEETEEWVVYIDDDGELRTRANYTTVVFEAYETHSDGYCNVTVSDLINWSHTLVRGELSEMVEGYRTCLESLKEIEEVKLEEAEVNTVDSDFLAMSREEIAFWKASDEQGI